MSDVISTYTDQEAVNDGVLVSLGSKDRVTSTVYHFLLARVSKRVPLQWPLEPHAKSAYEVISDPDMRVLMLCTALVRHYGPIAKKVYDDGNLWHAYLDASGSDINAIRPGTKEGLQLWIMPNELGGLTIMFPEDY